MSQIMMLEGIHNLQMVNGHSGPNWPTLRGRNSPFGEPLKPTASRRSNFYRRTITSLGRVRAKQYPGTYSPDKPVLPAQAALRLPVAADEQDKVNIVKKRVMLENTTAQYNNKVIALENTAKTVSKSVKSLKSRVSILKRSRGQGAQMRQVASQLHRQELQLRAIQTKVREQTMATQKAAIASGVLAEAAKLNDANDRQAVVAAAETILKTPQKVQPQKREPTDPNLPGVPSYQDLARNKLIVEEIIANRGKVSPRLLMLPGMGLRNIAMPMASTKGIEKLFRVNTDTEEIQVREAGPFGDFIARGWPGGIIGRVGGTPQRPFPVAERISEEGWIKIIDPSLNGFGAFDGSFWSDIGTSLKDDWTDFAKESVSKATTGAQTFVTDVAQKALSDQRVKDAITAGIVGAISKLGGSAGSSGYTTPVTESTALQESMGPGVDEKFLGIPTWVWPTALIVGATGYIYFRTKRGE